MTAIFNLAFVIFESVWRRAFGDDGFGLPILEHRFVLHLHNIVILFCYLYSQRHFNIYVCAYCVAVIQWLFYTRTFYAGFDMGHSYPPTDAEIAAYGRIGDWLKKIFPSSMWYRFGFDFCFMAIRYTYPLALVVYWFNPLLLAVGLLVAVSYAVGWKYKPFRLVTEFGEYCMGALLAIGLIFC